VCRWPAAADAGVIGDAIGDTIGDAVGDVIGDVIVVKPFRSS
jgi:hypothetical protein